MVTDWRSLAICDSTKVTLDYKALDIFAVSTTDYSGWQPTQSNLKAYEDLIIAEIDIETTGLDSSVDQIIMIGLIIHNGRGYEETIIIKPNKEKLLEVDCVDITNDRSLIKSLELFEEKQMILEFGHVLTQKNVEVMTAHNGYLFDFTFIYERLRFHQISSYLTVDTTFLTTLRNTSWRGQALEFYQPQHPKIQLIDTFCLVAQDDFVTRQLSNGYGLKSVPVEWGMRGESERVELNNDQIQHCWQTRDFNTLEAYLRDDLIDLKRLTDKLLPNYYYQLELLPNLKLQQICNWGNATKWNILLRNHYGKGWAKESPKLKFEGSYTSGIAGLFRYVSKVDVASLYPFIMLAYDICSIKDPQRLKLRILHYLRTQRFKLKPLKKSSDPIVSNGAKNRDTTAKVFLNSAYGDLGVMFKEFNDMVAAAAVTGYGRAIAHFVEAKLKALGATVIEVDTDGFIFTTGSFEGNQTIHAEILQYLPEGMNTPEMFEYEWEKRAIWIPANKADETGTEGQRKNYIMFNTDGKWKAKGRFVKRERSVLERTLQGELLNLWLDSHEAAKGYLRSIRRAIASGQYPVDQLKIKRLVKKSEVKMPTFGFPCGEYATFWMYQNGMKGVRPPKPNYEPTDSKKYSSIYYLELIDELIAELPNEVKVTL